jgi:hypothetical protein
MRLHHLCAVVACNALLGAAAFSGCATGGNGLTTGSGGNGTGAGPGASSSATTTTGATTTTTTSATTGTGGSSTSAGTGGLGVGGAGTAGGMTTGTGGSNGCTHDVCTVGAPLDPTCDACTAAVCDAANDPFCCDPTGMWDTSCVGMDVPMYCAAMTCAVDAGTPDASPPDAGMDAGGTDAGVVCAHDVCTVGAALHASCGTCEAAVCAVGHDPFCCKAGGSWDTTCAGSDLAMYCPGTSCGADAGSLDAGGMDAGGMDAGSVDAGSCALTHVVISQVRSRGMGGANDEFIELYNPTTVDVTLDSTWKIMGKSTGSTTYTARWTGNGGIIPTHGHYLMTGANYTQMPARDQALSAGITDAASLVLSRAGTQIDAVCYAFDAPTTTAVSAFTCEGTPVSNAPHNNGTAGASNTNVSFERKLGGSAGNCVDTDDNASDFAALTPATPRSSLSPAVP